MKILIRNATESDGAVEEENIIFLSRWDTFQVKQFVYKIRIIVVVEDVDYFVHLTCLNQESAAKVKSLLCLLFDEDEIKTMLLDECHIYKGNIEELVFSKELPPIDDFMTVDM